jgi:choline dehydrogenase-like flavoprotein
MQELDCDVLIIGSGAAGGTLAGTLSENTKLRIVVLEQGGHYTRSFFNQHEWDMRVLYANDGARFEDNGAIPIRGGECVGGGTTINVALCFSPVRNVWERWQREHGLRGFSFDTDASDYGVPGLSLARATQQVRERIGVAVAKEAEINRNNQLFRRGCEALGINSKPFELNMRGCVGCGFCTLGCAYDAKQGTMVTYLKDALARDVTLIHHCRVERLEYEKRAGTVTAVGAFAEVRPTRPGSQPNAVPKGRLHLRAKLVIVAAGAVESPLLLMRSDHPDPHDLLGRGLVIHPSLPVIGLMDEEVAGHKGIEGSVYSDHFAQSHGFYLECLFGHPLYGAALLPGLGEEHFALMKEYRRLAGFGVMLLDQPQRENRVLWNRVLGRPSIQYRLAAADAARLRFAAQRAIEVMLAAGAREALLPSEERLGPLATPRFQRPEQAVHCQELRFVPHQTVLTSAHAQASVKMDEDATRGMLSSRAECHGTRNLLVVDASSFPGSCGANPMLSIMSMARYQGQRIVAEWTRYEA